MTKGKPWELKELTTLRQLLDEGKSIQDISRALVKTEEAIRQKMFDLKLKEEKHNGSSTLCFSSSKLEYPSDLPSIEQMLRVLAAVLKALETPGLDKNEILRLRGIIVGVKVYQERFEEYVRYREIEAELQELRSRYEELRKKTESNESK